MLRSPRMLVLLRWAAACTAGGSLAAPVLHWAGPLGMLGGLCFGLPQALVLDHYYFSLVRIRLWVGVSLVMFGVAWQVGFLGFIIKIAVLSRSGNPPPSGNSQEHFVDFLMLPALLAGLVIGLMQVWFLVPRVRWTWLWVPATGIGVMLFWKNLWGGGVVVQALYAAGLVTAGSGASTWEPVMLVLGGAVGGLGYGLVTGGLLAAFLKEPVDVD